MAEMVELSQTELTGSVSAPRDSELHTIARLATRYRELEIQLSQLADATKAANIELSEIREVELPRAMAAANTESYTTTDGVKVALGLEYQCPQLDDGPDRKNGRTLVERLKAFDWLDAAGHGDIAKSVITVGFSKGDEALSNEIMDMLRAHRAANRAVIERRRTVPWNTLSGFARDREDAGEYIPLETLGVSKRRAAKVTTVKAKGAPGRNELG